MTARWKRTLCHCRYAVCIFFFGLIAGSLLGVGTRLIFVRCFRSLDCETSNELVPYGVALPQLKLSESLPLTTDMNLVLVGVMTAKAFLRSRVIPAYDTWVKSVPGKVIFFSSEGSELPERPDIPLVALPGVDDSYPPQRKSFMMMRYMHDHFLNDFRFFMRADDDIYVRGELLGHFLHSINSTGRALYIGQAGQGNKEEFGHLNLKHEDNFCMGGPGMILSRDTLQRTVPYVGYCLRHLLTTHEDVEIGRCITRFTGASCTWAYEMQKIMYNNYREPKGSFTHSLRDTDIHLASTLHPVKNASYQYRLHEYFLARSSARLRNRLSQLQRQINDMNEYLQDRDEYYSPNRYGLHPSLSKSPARTRSDVQNWDFLSSRSVYSVNHANPKRGHEEDLRVGVADIVRQVMDSINRNARQRGRVIEYKDLLYGYRRLNPLHGPDYMLDLLLIYRKFKGKRRMTVPVRRHAYLQQAFLEPEFRASPMTVSVATLNANDKVEGKKTTGGDSTGKLLPTSKPVTVNFILPLAGRYKTFLQFMDSFEKECLSNDGEVTLVVVLFEEGGDVESITSRMNITSSRYPLATIRLVRMSGTFSRGAGLQRGAALFPRTSLLFFIDVDIQISRDVLHRIRLNTAPGRGAYYPIVFSQYDPLMARSTASDPFNSDAGYWRQFGYGIAAFYNSDFIDAGGFDLEIRGWGREDVDLVERLIARNVTIFRAVDVSLVHVFHTITCDPALDPAQYQMCLGSKAASFASLGRLSAYVRAVPEIYRRDESAGGGGAVASDILEQLQQQQAALIDQRGGAGGNLAAVPAGDS